jgi:hypothetical protein
MTHEDATQLSSNENFERLHKNVAPETSGPKKRIEGMEK